jgi:hypothetical protein
VETPSRPYDFAPFANTPEFYAALGCFYAAWSRTDLAIDCAVWKATGTETEEQTHKRVAGMKFSDKCKHFRSLVDTGKFQYGDKVKDLLVQIEKHSMRNVFAHSFLASDEQSVMFIHRQSRRGKYEALGYKFARDQFFDHVQNFVQLSFDLEHLQPIALL